MSKDEHEKYEYNQKGTIKVKLNEGEATITTSGIKETLMRIEAVNVLRKLGKPYKSKIKDDKVLLELTEKISGDIEILSSSKIK